MIKGKRLEWFVNYVDERNNVLFQLENDHLTTVSMVDRTKKVTKMPVHINREELVTVVMDVSDSSVSVNIGQQDNKFPESISTGHAAGKFAFRIPGKEQNRIVGVPFRSPLISQYPPLCVFAIIVTGSRWPELRGCVRPPPRAQKTPE